MESQKNNITLHTQDASCELNNSKHLCNLLMKTPHYAKMGAEGVFAIVEEAKTLGIDVRKALGGGLYYVKGRVEMSARTMGGLIRAQKHSVTRDKRSDNTICILHGKRADNGDTWTESFSIVEAQEAGLTKNPVWKNYARDMLFARALSRLARQLFQDVIGNCYVEQELACDDNIIERKEADSVGSISEAVVVPISDEECSDLNAMLDQIPEYKDVVMSFLEKKGISNLNEMPVEMYEKVIHKAKEKLTEGS